MSLEEKIEKTIAYPTPGYPVYRNSILFANGTPYATKLEEKNNFEVRPWEFLEEVQKDLAAVWINYPHNPTGKMVSKEYLVELINWCDKNEVLLLSDECYIDIYDPKHTDKPVSISELTDRNFIAYMSLSKRSGITGYRSGFVLAEEKLINDLKRARANFGVGSPTFIQAAAVKAWDDEKHVEERRSIFSERLDVAYNELKDTGLVSERPKPPSIYGVKLQTEWMMLNFV